MTKDQLGTSSAKPITRRRALNLGVKGLTAGGLSAAAFTSGLSVGGPGLNSGALMSSANAMLHPHPEDGAPLPLGAWTPMADMPFAVQEIYPVAHRLLLQNKGSLKPVFKSLLVNAGGLTPEPGFKYNVSDKVSIYDAALNQWSSGPSLPRPAHHVALVSNNGRLYSIGGFLRDKEGGWRMRSRCYVLDDLFKGKWRDMARLPLPQAETVAVSLRGRIHVVSGRSPGGSQNQEWNDHIDTDKHWVYVAGADQWVERRPIPAPRNSAAGAVFQDALYVIGGRSVTQGNSARVDVYDPLADRWQTAAPLPPSQNSQAPIGRGGLAAAVWRGHIYVFGGEWRRATSGGVYSQVWEYDPKEDRWRGVAAMPRPRHGLGAVPLQDGIYIAGGAAKPGGEETSAALDRFTI